VAVVQVPGIVRVTFKYTLAQAETVTDYAEHGVCYLAGEVPTDADTIEAVLQDMADAAYASVVANVTPTHFCTNIGLMQVRVALEQTNGKTLFEKFRSYGGAYVWNGTSSSYSLPWDNAFCLSLYAYEPGTFDPFHKSKQGRTYLPPLSAASLKDDNTGLIDGTAATDIADDWGQVFKELQEHDYSGFPAFSPVLVVNSRRYVEAFPVTWLRFDNKMDTQRRRFNKQSTVIGKAPFPGD